MSCSYSVQFLPDSLADFDDQIKVGFINYKLQFIDITIFMVIGQLIFFYSSQRLLLKMVNA